MFNRDFCLEMCISFIFLIRKCLHFLIPLIDFNLILKYSLDLIIYNVIKNFLSFNFLKNIKIIFKYVISII